MLRLTVIITGEINFMHFRTSRLFPIIIQLIILSFFFFFLYLYVTIPQKDKVIVINLSICSTIMWRCFRDIISNWAYQKSGSPLFGGCKYILSAQNFLELYWRLAIFTQLLINCGGCLMTSVTSKIFIHMSNHTYNFLNEC